MTIHVDWQSLDSDGNWLELDREAKQQARIEAIREKHRAARINKMRMRPYQSDADWDESKHPRGEHGRWAEGFGGAKVGISSKTAELISHTAGLKGIIPYLTEDEIGLLKRQNVATLVRVFSELPKPTEMAAVAFSGQAKRGWYRKSAKAIVGVFGATDAPRFAALLAAMSPMTSVESNAVNALSTWTNWVKANRPTDRAAIIRIMGESVQGKQGEQSLLPGWIGNSVTALQSEAPESLVLSGPKVSSFAKDLRGEVNAVAWDTWMANYANMNQDLFRRTATGGKGAAYIAASAVTRKAAAIATKLTGSHWDPDEIQETVWSWAKTLYEKASADSTTVRQLLQAGGVTRQDIADTPDFAVLFTQNVYRKILESGGYGQQVAELAAGSGSAAGLPGAGSPLTAAQGSGFTQSAFVRHLYRAAGRLDLLRAHRAEERVSHADYDPDQPRDPQGQWTTGGGDQTDTPQFKKWFGNSKVVNANGKPLVVYHGTVRNIEQFGHRHPNTEANWGVGFYFSNSIADINANYASVEGPDLRGRIERRAEQIEAEADRAERHGQGVYVRREGSYEAAVKQATKEMVKQQGAIIPVYVKMENPFVVGGKNETFLDYDAGYDEKNDDYTNPETGKVTEFIKNFGQVAQDYDDADISGVQEKIMEEAIDGGIKASRLEDIIRKDEKFYYAEDPNTGMYVSQEIFRQALERTGFDGVIDRRVNTKFGEDQPKSSSWDIRPTGMTGVKKDTIHYVVFDPTHVKSAIGNKGTFDPNSPRLIDWADYNSDAVRDFAPFEETEHPRDPHGHWIEKGSTEQTGPQRRFAELRQQYQQRVMRYREAHMQHELQSLAEQPDYDPTGYINNHFEEDEPERAEELHERVDSFFPENAGNNHIKILNDTDGGYNCFAWAIGETETWEVGTDVEDRLLAAGAEQLDPDDAEAYAPEPGIVTIAEYFDADGEATHMARQLPSGRWTSKLGPSALIEHDLQDLEGGDYGKVGAIFKIPRDQWEGIRYAA